jgi:hypothetical protein
LIFFQTLLSIFFPTFWCLFLPTGLIFRFIHQSQSYPYSAVRQWCGCCY